MSQISFSLKDLLDLAVSIVAKGRLNTTQANSLLEILESEADENNSLFITAAYAIRQGARNNIDRMVANNLARTLLKIQKELPEGEKKETARKLLGLVKWMVEIQERVRMNFSGMRSFEDLVSRLRG